MPASVGTSRARAFETGEAKLWALLVGVNQYADQRLSPLSYSALDCQGLAEAITAATRTFPQKTVLVHHDFAAPGEALAQSGSRSLPEQVAVAKRMGLGTVTKLRNFPASAPQFTSVQASLHRIVQSAKPQDTVLFYFSGHGVLDAASGQAVLCLTDTQPDRLTQTGLSVQALVGLLGQCAAHQQIVWLDACHSGGMTLRSSHSGRSSHPGFSLPNPTPQLLEVLQQQAARSQGFYALLSCDQHQQSWEFPELGHGVFTYYLMRGLLGEAADAQGVIEADALYKYVYYQTLRYIDKTNQQLRLINQQKRGKGEIQIQPEYPQQTPKRIVEGIGELMLGTKPELVSLRHPRQALVVEGLATNPQTLKMSKILRSEGGFELSYLPQGQPQSGQLQSGQLQSGQLQSGQPWREVQAAIQTCFQVELDTGSSEAGSESMPSTGTGASELSHAATVLLYLRGRIKTTPTGDASLVLRNQVEVSRSWLRQVLRRSPIAHQVVILDCPEAQQLEDWIEDLQTSSGRGQCLIAVASPAQDPDWFINALVETLSTADPQVGLPIAAWIAQLHTQAAAAGLTPQIWLSGTQGVIEVLPGRLGQGSGEALDLGICPYLGLRAFNEADAPFFFGRAALTQQILEAIQQSAFLAVVGASGSGKSSVVQAGLMAQLRQGKQIPGSGQWWIQCFRPGERPLNALVQCLAMSDRNLSVELDLEDSEASVETNIALRLEGILYQGVESFVYWLRSRPEPMVVLVIDQFEELFTLAAAADRQRFLELILGALEHADDRFKLVITLRSDFIAPCLEYPVLAKHLQQSNLLVSPVLQPEDYRQVIVRPAEKVGLEVDPELTEVLLQELSHLAGDLPLLEFVLEQLWEQRRPGSLTLQSYQQQIGGLKGALERKAQALYDQFDPDAQACARWIFLSLTQLGEGSEDTRRRVAKSDLIVKKYPAPLVDRTLQALTAAKLVIVSTEPVPTSHPLASSPSASSSPPSPSPPITIEVAHEILIRHWSTLRWWLEENRSRLRSQRQIAQAADQWQQSGQQDDFLLRGVRLDGAEELYVKYTDELPQNVQLFIEAGLLERDRAQKQIKRRLRQTQAAVVLVSTLGLSAAGLGGLAYFQRQQALVNEISALNALSESQLRSDQPLESLTTSLTAGKKLDQVVWLMHSTQRQSELTTQTVATLQQAIAETRESNRLVGHSQRVNSVATHGQQMVSGSDDGTVRLWQADGTLIRQVELGERVTAVAVSPDGAGIAAALADGTAVLWKSNLWEPNQQQQPNHPQQIKLPSGDWTTSLAFSADGQQLATVNRNRTIKLWNVQQQTLLKTLTGHAGFVNAVQFSPDGRSLASAGEDGKVILWDIPTGTIQQTLTGHQGRVSSLSFSPEGNWLASAGEDQIVRLWQKSPGKSPGKSSKKSLEQFSAAKQLTGHRQPIYSVQFSPDGQRLISASADRTLQLWDINLPTPLATFKGHGEAVLSAQFTSDGQAIVSGSADKTLRIWDAQVPQRPSDPTYALSLSSPHSIYGAGTSQGEIQLWRYERGSDRSLLAAPILQRSWQAHSALINTLSFSPAGATLVSGSDDDTLKLWSLEGQLLQTLSGHQARVISVQFSPDAQWLASASEDQTVRLWNAKGDALRVLSGHGDGVNSVAWHPDSALIASGSSDRTIKLWRLDGTLVRTLTGHGSAVAVVAFSPDGETLASASWDNTIKLWDVSDGKLLYTLTGHQEGVTQLRFMPAESMLLSGSADRTIKLWDIQQGTLVKTLMGQSDDLLSLDLSPDGRTLATGSESGIRQWILSLSDLRQQACTRIQNYLRTHPHLTPEERSLCNPM